MLCEVWPWDHQIGCWMLCEVWAVRSPDWLLDAVRSLGREITRLVVGCCAKSGREITRLVLDAVRSLAVRSPDWLLDVMWSLAVRSPDWLLDVMHQDASFIVLCYMPLKLCSITDRVHEGILWLKATIVSSLTQKWTLGGFIKFQNFLVFLQNSL